MTPEEIKQKVLEYGDWEFWLDRPFGAFLMSSWGIGQSREYMRRVGVNVEWPAIIFQNGSWYKSEKVWNEFSMQLQTYLDAGGSVANIVKRCEDMLPKGTEEIKFLENSQLSIEEKLSKICDILGQLVSFVWLAHGLEHYYVKILRQEVPKYMTGDIEKNIGDISFPKKKNANFYFLQALKSDQSLSDIQKKFGWIKARGGFANGFTVEELSAERKRLVNSPEDEIFTRPNIPKELLQLSEIAQDLVYFRTLRTDVLFELMWIARPVLNEIAKFYGLTFEELRDYSALDLLKGRKEKFEYDNFSAISYGKYLTLFHEPVLVENNIEKNDLIKGVVAFKGSVKGRVKIVKTAEEIEKVLDGDILVATTTVPSFIIGMHRAAAFVTDEGGITSHAAIVARELRKPCIIGTKIATKVLKDGDIVEVDAERGIITILKQ